MSKTFEPKTHEKPVKIQSSKTCPLRGRVRHGLHEPIQFIAHSLRGHASGSTFKVLFSRDVAFSEEAERPSATRTMLDTPLVRGERDRISVGVVRLVMIDE
jgi:hypothetical protein